AEMENDLYVLPCGMENLGHAPIGHQPEEGIQIEIRRQRIDQRVYARRRHLDQAKLRPERRFADEFGIDRDESGFFEGENRRFEFFLRCYDVHESSFKRKWILFPFSLERVRQALRPIARSRPVWRARRRAVPGARKSSMSARVR